MDKKHIVLVDRKGSSKFKGGDTVQINAIANFLMEHKFHVIITQDLEEFLKTNNKNIDLIILFNLTNHYELLDQWRLIKDKSIPYYVFPIYWDLNKEIPIHAYVGIGKRILHLLPEGIFNFLKWIKFAKTNIRKVPIKEIFKYLFLKFQINKMLINAHEVLVNSEAEKKHLINKFNLNVKNNNVHVIYNGVSTDTLLEDSEIIPVPFSSYICCVGGIGPRKNQLSLIKAANKTNIPLVIIGQPSVAEKAYYKKLLKISNDNIYFTGYLERKFINQLLRRSRGHIQPSYIETPGLVSLEAALLGCKICVSDVEPVREYFKNGALYCNPHSIESIRECLYELWNSTNFDISKVNILDEYNWEIVLHPLLGKINTTLGRK